MTIHRQQARSNVHDVAPDETLRTRHGFTLVELLFVLIIVGIMATMMAPLLNPGRWRADSAAQELSMSLNAAQRLAVLRQHDVVVNFNMTSSNVMVFEDRNNNGKTDTGEPTRLIELPETTGFSAGSTPTLPEGAGPVSFTPIDGTPRLTFHRNGSASQSGIIYLKPLVGNLSTSRQATRALTIERATGEIRCYSYRTGAWVTPC